MIVVEGELYSSKNSRQILINRSTGRPFVSKSKVAMVNEKTLLSKLIPLRDEFLNMLKGMEKPYHISFKIYRQTKRRFDYINIVQNLCDCMVKAGLIEDDCADEIIPFFEPYEVDKNNPRVEIKVKE